MLLHFQLRADGIVQHGRLEFRERVTRPVQAIRKLVAAEGGLQLDGLQVVAIPPRQVLDRVPEKEAPK